jgi:hypothetical protein
VKTYTLVLTEEQIDLVEFAVADERHWLRDQVAHLNKRNDPDGARLKANQARRERYSNLLTMIECLKGDDSE